MLRDRGGPKSALPARTEVVVPGEDRPVLGSQAPFRIA